MTPAATDSCHYNRRYFLAARWAIYTILVLAYMLVFFHRMAPAVVSSDLMRAFNTSGAALGSLAAMYFYIYTAMQIPSGVLADTLGARATVTIGNLVAGGGSILFGLAATFGGGALGRLMVGLGVSVVFVGLLKSNSLWFRDRHYAMVAGLTLLLGNVGSIASAGPLAAVLGSYSWRTVFVFLGLVSLSLALFSLLLVRNTPQALGFPSVREMEGKKPHNARYRHWTRDLLQILGTRKAWPAAWSNLGMIGSLLAFIGLWAIPYLRDVHGLDRSTAAVYTTWSLSGFACGSLLAGWLSDRMGRRKPVILAGTVLYALSCLGLAYLPWQPGPWGVALFALLGFSGGGFVVTYAYAKEVAPPALAGMAVGLVNTGNFLGVAIAQPLIGWVMDLNWNGRMVDGLRIYATGDYRLGFGVLLVFAALGVLGAAFISETLCRNVSGQE